MTRALVDGAAADVVPVLGQIGQVREISEGADHAHGAVTRQALEQSLECLVSLVVGIAAEGHRQFADLLDQFVSLGTFLGADHVAQDAAEQTDVFDQRFFVVAALAFGAGRGVGSGFHGQQGIQACN